MVEKQGDMDHLFLNAKRAMVVADGNIATHIDNTEAESGIRVDAAYTKAAAR
jgi:hypothetical protein